MAIWLSETAVTRRAENLDDVLAQRRATPIERALDRLDAPIISVGRTIWRAMVDGLVARAYAEYGPPVDLLPDRVDEHRSEQEALLVKHYTYAVPNKSYIAGEFEGLQSLIEGIPAMRG
jgi:hypothetical protein